MHPYEIPIWKQAPFIRLLIPFVVGILWQWYVSMNTTVIFTGGFCCLISLILFSRLPVYIRYRHAYTEGIFLFLIFLFFAAWLVQQRDLRSRPNWYGHFAEKGSTYLMTIREPLTEKQNSYSAIASVEAVSCKNGIVNTIGEVLVYFKKSKATAALKYGDRIQSTASPHAIRNFGNPGEFDNKRYRAFKQVYQQYYIDDAHYKLLNSTSGSDLYAVIYFFRDGILRILRTYIPESKGQLGIAEALLIGYRNDLDSDLLNAYANTGVVHIIAISGLHLGLIYAVLVWLLSVIPLVKHSKITQAVVIILFLWTFSLMTGASASVMRSAVMFTVIIIGKTINRNSSIYNSLAASAFLLLCYNPFYLWDVGFQLSYLAIMGIVWLQKPIQRRWLPENRWISKVWEMISITLAAQVFTFPICLYYFHQFPNYFLPVNLITVPLSTVILFAEILLLLLSPLQVCAHWLGFTIGKGIVWMNATVDFFNDLPFAQITNIHANAWTSLLLYLCIIFLTLFLLVKKYRLLFIALLTFLLFYFLIFASHTKTSNQHKLIVYNLSRHFSMDIIRGVNYVNISDSSLLQDKKLMSFFLKGSRIFHYLNNKPDQHFLIPKGSCSLEIQGNKVLILQAVHGKFELPVFTDPDCVIVLGNGNLEMEAIQNLYKPKLILFAANSLWKIAKWKKECDRVALPCFSIPEQGAFVLDLNTSSSKAPE